MLFLAFRIVVKAAPIGSAHSLVAMRHFFEHVHRIFRHALTFYFVAVLGCGFGRSLHHHDFYRRFCLWSLGFGLGRWVIVPVAMPMIMSMIAAVVMAAIMRMHMVVMMIMVMAVALMGRRMAVVSVSMVAMIMGFWGVLMLMLVIMAVIVPVLMVMTVVVRMVMSVIMSRTMFGGVRLLFQLC